MSTYKRPLMGEIVNIIENETMFSVGKGKLISFTRSQIVIEDLYRKRYTKIFDARVHHFEGYEPTVMLVKRNGELVKKWGGD